VDGIGDSREFQASSLSLQYLTLLSSFDADRNDLGDNLYRDELGDYLDGLRDSCKLSSTFSIVKTSHHLFNLDPDRNELRDRDGHGMIRLTFSNLSKPI
jgi:hypothetical protein